MGDWATRYEAIMDLLGVEPEHRAAMLPVVRTVVVTFLWARLKELRAGR
jgi:hypothetical protein